ncbi:MAG: YHS domain-containing protein, partial [Rhodospirillaceae bacterium]|nr:YHS domain-containing protein [Rhodospirillaceae bacterium]
MSDTEVHREEFAIDPVCGMQVSQPAEAPTLEHDGDPYYFCGAGCAKKFETDPLGY